ncbi:hypothetical protein Golax_025405 [Gossypium laxum]|uniref:Uncharacterized protein n=1 Tax=Gossypium laxum TaxID=34288 RepID=A0A7J9B778_9ROSI|nr:hypothetical protein [Gossypium laxum]
MNKEVSSDGVTDLDDTRGGQPSFEDKLVSITKVVGKLASWDNDLDINVLEEDVAVSREGLYPEIQFLNRVHELSDENMGQVLILISNNDYDRILTDGPWQAYGVTWLSSLGVGLDLENREHQGTTTMLGVDKDMDTTYSEAVSEDLKEDQLNG